MSGIASPGRRPVTDGGFQLQVDGTDLAGCGIVAVSPDFLDGILCEPVLCDTHHPAFSGATPRSDNTAELNGLAEALRWTCSFIPHSERVRFFYDSKPAARVTLLTPEGTLP